MEEIVKSLKASVTSLKSANTKYRNEIERLKAYSKEADELNKQNVEKIQMLTKMLTKELEKTKSELQNLKCSVIGVVDELNKTKQERDDAIDALEKAKKPWWKNIF